MTEAQADPYEAAVAPYPLLLSVRDLMTITGLTRATLCKHIRQGAFPAALYHSRQAGYRVPRADVVEYLRERDRMPSRETSAAIERNLTEGEWLARDARAIKRSRIAQLADLSPETLQAWLDQVLPGPLVSVPHFRAATGLGWHFVRRMTWLGGVPWCGATYQELATDHIAAYLEARMEDCDLFPQPQTPQADSA